ncbi:MAG: TIGR03546 family protein [Ignavibacteria bacterium]|nr:TIGR03546 family protein [Ignavibacteria bacterium]
MFWLKIIKDFIKILREGQTPAQIAGGFALGSLLGFSPMFTLQGLLVWLVIFVLNVNLASAILSITLFSLFAFLLDPVFHRLGYLLLVQIDGLRDLWTSLYNAPVAPLTRFNNTVVLGSLAFAVLSFIPIYVGMKRFVVAYRKNVGNRIEQWKLYQSLKKSTLVQWYLRIRDFGG